MDHGIVLSAIYPEIMTNCSQMLSRLKEAANHLLYNCVELYFSGSEQEEKQINQALSDLDLRLVFLAGFPMKEERILLQERKKYVDVLYRMFMNCMNTQRLLEQKKC